MSRTTTSALLAASLLAFAEPVTAQLDHCQPQQPVESLAERPSPYDSLRVDVGDAVLLVCYGRPSARGRTMLGGDMVPYGNLWRTGANEPTTLHIPFAATIAGIAVTPGSYSLYSVPGATEWTIIVNRATDQWGHEGRYTPEVEAQEVGRGTVTPGSTAAHVETFTISSVAADGGADLVLEWESTRVAIPVRRGEGRAGSRQRP
jgi:hypothetical protein